MSNRHAQSRILKERKKKQAAKEAALIAQVGLERETHERELLEKKHLSEERGRFKERVLLNNNNRSKKNYCDADHVKRKLNSI
jgi:hypothetical protein